MPEIGSFQFQKRNLNSLWGCNIYNITEQLLFKRRNLNWKFHLYLLILYKMKKLHSFLHLIHVFTLIGVKYFLVTFQWPHSVEKYHFYFQRPKLSASNTRVRHRAVLTTNSQWTLACKYINVTWHCRYHVPCCESFSELITWSPFLHKL